MDYRCAYVDDVGDVCEGEGAEVYLHLPLCEKHKEETQSRLAYFRTSTPCQSLNYHSFTDFPGFCYAVLVPGGNVKIGYSNTEDLLSSRLKSLRRSLGPVFVLAVFPGGFVTEAYLHRQLHDYRTAGTGEQFAYTDEVAEVLSKMNEEHGLGDFKP